MKEVDSSTRTPGKRGRNVQVVMGKLLTFDRKADVEGQPNRGVESPAPVAAK